MSKITEKKLSDYTQDAQNFNKGNEFGESLIAKSIDRFGAGRSLLAASDGTLIAGNKSHQKLAEAGIENVIEVETDGKTAVVVKRTDIKSGSKQFHEMALADNASALKNITFDAVLIEEVLGEEILTEWGLEGSPKGEDLIGEEKNKLPVMKITFPEPSDLQDCENDIQELLNKKCPKAFYSVSAGEL